MAHAPSDGSDGFYNYNGGATSQSLGSGYIDIMGDHAYPLNNYMCVFKRSVRCIADPPSANSINQEKPLATREPKGFFVSTYPE
ncbi:hypothetical protein EMMF5_001966 [Cystobasidiomycetes sp. EMM_F5]